MGALNLILLPISLAFKTFQKEINKRYRKLAKELHPDHNKAEDAHEKFELLVAAYEVR